MDPHLEQRAAPQRLAAHVDVVRVGHDAADEVLQGVDEHGSALGLRRLVGAFDLGGRLAAAGRTLVRGVRGRSVSGLASVSGFPPARRHLRRGLGLAPASAWRRRRAWRQRRAWRRVGLRARV